MNQILKVSLKDNAQTNLKITLLRHTEVRNFSPIPISLFIIFAIFLPRTVKIKQTHIKQHSSERSSERSQRTLG
jgi:hypothetical protein